MGTLGGGQPALTEDVLCARGHVKGLTGFSLQLVMPVIVFFCFDCVFLFCFVFCILQLGLKEVKELAQGHPATTCWHQEQTLGSCTELLVTLWPCSLSPCMCKTCV